MPCDRDHVCDPICIRLQRSSRRPRRACSRLLRPGGVLFGTAPDGEAVVHAVGDARELRLSPPEHQFAVLLRLLPKRDDDGDGQPVIFSLEDTVTSGTAESGCIEFLCRREALVAAAAAHGLEPIEMTSLADAKTDSPLKEPLTDAERHVASLYYCFALRKTGGATGGQEGGRGANGTNDRAARAASAPLPPPAQASSVPAPQPPAAIRGDAATRIGAYFGAFDPIHENHVAVAKHALAAHGLDAVYLVSNTDNPRKPFVSSLRDRAALIDARLAEPDCKGVRRFHVRERQSLDWRGRDEVCREIRAQVLQEHQALVGGGGGRGGGGGGGGRWRRGTRRGRWRRASHRGIS